MRSRQEVCCDVYLDLCLLRGNSIALVWVIPVSKDCFCTNSRMKPYLIVLVCLLVATASTEARRRKRARTPRLRFNANPPVVIDEFSEELKLDCRVASSPDGTFPIYLLLQRTNQNGTVNMGLQMMKRTDLLAEDNRTSAGGAIAESSDDDSYLTLTIQQPGASEEGEYVCQYLYLTPEVNTISASANVTVRALPPGETYVPPPVVASESCCDELYAEIDKLKDALAAKNGNVKAGVPVVADDKCRVAFSAGLREERGYLLRSSKTVQFDTILTNKGGAYDDSTGKFTAPCTGQYFFSLTLTALHSSSGSVEGIIRRGNKNQARSYSFTSLGYDEIHSGSTSVLLTLEEGEEVDVYLMASSSGEFMGGDQTIFSGYYLYP